MEDPEFEPRTDLQTQEILLASSHHDIPKLRSLLRNTNANVQDPETGFTPLHAAIAALEQDGDESVLPHRQAGAINGASATVNGSGADAEIQATYGAAEDDDKDEEREQELDAAAGTVRFLFQHGAVWNEMDAEGETPGCLAKRLGLEEIYEIVVDQGVRAELRVTRQDEYQILLEDDGGGEPEEVQAPATDINAADEMNDAVIVAVENFVANTSSSNWTSDAALMDTIYTRTAGLLLPTRGLSILTIQPTVSLLEAVQEQEPRVHCVITTDRSLISSPDSHDAWRHTSQSTTIDMIEGTWLECLQTKARQRSTPGSAAQSQGVEWNNFDAIFFGGDDAEYQHLRSFFQQWAGQLLAPEGGPEQQGGVLSFWHGWGSERQVEYDVYTKIMEMDLFEADFDVEWTEIEVQNSRERGPSTYKLPICRIVD